ncbi:lipase family protein, partial [Escherichia coli]|uniref:lipase family protein n=1 Tax=Escherichia coli TaxID=562 RepID=UPI002156FCD2
KYLNDRGRVDRVRAEPMCFGETLNTFRGSTIDMFTTSNPMVQPDWRARLAENALGKTAPQAPVYMWHGVNDQVLPYAATAKLRAEWCEEGTALQFKAIRKTDHVKTAIFGIPDAMAWITARVRNKPVPNNCGSLAKPVRDNY